MSIDEWVGLKDGDKVINIKDGNVETIKVSDGVQYLQNKYSTYRLSEYKKEDWRKVDVK